jgi:hypothetical protein
VSEHAADDAIRVSLVGCTGLLGDIIRQAVCADPGIRIVAELPAADAFGAEFDPADADLVLWNNADEAEVAHLMSWAARRPRVLATLTDGRDASLWELKPRRSSLGVLSPTTLIETIHTHGDAGGTS